MITLVPAGNPGAFTGPTGNNTWLVDGAEPLLVDAGVGAAWHLDRLRRLLGGRALARVFLTHGHRDHAAGLPALRGIWPGVIVHGGTEAPAAAGEWIPAGDGSLQVVATPGHSADHACLWDPASRVLFTGDLLVRGGTVMIAASSGGSLREYLASLARVRALAPVRAYPGHGPVIDEPAALIDEYIAHRRAREQQMLDALRGGAPTVDALVTAIYPDLADALRDAARETVRAHLHKLEEEGVAAERAGEWSLRR
jgi:glyoxylase-like metal-dependent hydrolase (beta-lactamase superfamily II)